MNDLIAVFRMEEVSIDARIRVIEKLGRAINHQYAMNATDDLVKELCDLLREKQEQS